MPIYKHVMTGPQLAGDMWSAGIHSDQNDANISNAHEAWTTAVETLFGGAGLAPLYPASTAVREVITYALDPATGRATGVRRSSVTLNGGTADAPQGSPRNALVAGLRTLTPGAAGRGRMFLPAPTLARLTLGGMVNDATRQAAADAIGLGLGALVDGGMRPGLWRQGLTAVLPYVSVTIGQVLGVQRRRTNKIPNAYLSATI